MLRAACSSLRSSRATHAHQRTFVSSVLLSKTYEDKTVAELRAELRSRRLPVSGSKATLITRIQRSDTERLSPDSLTDTPLSVTQNAQQKLQQASTRSLSTSSSISNAAPTPSTHATHASSNIFDIKLPDVSQLPAEEPVQIPFLPDSWNSYAIKAETEPQPEEIQAPKIMLAAGAETHAAGGPTFAMSSATDTLPSESEFNPTPSQPRKDTGVVGDILEDLGVTADVFALATGPVPVETIPKRVTSRPLNGEEQRGVYVLLGLLFGSWVVGGIAAPA